MDTGQVRNLPEKVDVYVIDADGTVTLGAGYTPDVYISDEDAGRLFEKEVAQHIYSTYGTVVGVMRDVEYSALPQEFKTHKMILGKVDLP